MRLVQSFATKQHPQSTKAYIQSCTCAHSYTKFTLSLKRAKELESGQYTYCLHSEIIDNISFMHNNVAYLKRRFCYLWFLFFGVEEFLDLLDGRPSHAVILLHLVVTRR